MINAVPLFSGSSGNCTFVESGDTRVLIDAGVSCLSVTKALREIGRSIEDISAIFVTHEHCDHIKGLEIIAKKYHVPVYINAMSADYIFADRAYENLSECAVIKNPGDSCAVGNMCFDIFKTPHDSVGSVCYHVSDRDGDTFGLATDIGYITKGIAAALIGCRQVVIESNHDLDMLRDGPYPYILKQRILSDRGHLSNKDCARFLPFLAEKGAEKIWLAHLSAENNTPEIALSESEKSLLDTGFDKCSVEVAPRSII